ncbi:hypothetical protein mRhiFer1_009407 [Rhinolophus ferrumequinum]|uniref:Uncharacterized protein n=1 Tax=Rhinolophus ferrumequinum TaxID=59479 RepID=A0A7J7RPR7_RHIFE|nr:hypothetical protein mRhiFer1_009407 [Rhinolophus ferrumequinum]
MNVEELFKFVQFWNLFRQTQRRRWREKIEDKMGEREDREDEDKESETVPTVVPKSLYPNLEDCLKDTCPPSMRLSHLPSPPPSFREQMWGSSRSVVKNKNPFLSKSVRPLLRNGTCSSISAIERGIHQAGLEGNLDALAFPIVIRECEAPTEEHPDGVHEAVHEPFSFKLLKELKQAVLQFGPTSPYTIGLLRGIADGN